MNRYIKVILSTNNEENILAGIREKIQQKNTGKMILDKSDFEAEVKFNDGISRCHIR